MTFYNLITELNLSCQNPVFICSSLIASTMNHATGLECIDRRHHYDDYIATFTYLFGIINHIRRMPTFQYKLQLQKPVMHQPHDNNTSVLEFLNCRKIKQWSSWGWEEHLAGREGEETRKKTKKKLMTSETTASKNHITAGSLPLLR